MVKNSKKSSFLLKIAIIIIFTILGITTFYLIFDKHYFLSGVTQVLGLYDKDILVYDTFTLSFSEDVNSDLKDEIVDILDDISFDDVKRFEFVESGGDITISNVNSVQDQFVFSDSYLVPVGHIYWVEDGVLDTQESVYVTNSSDLEFLERYTDYEVILNEDDINFSLEREDIPTFVKIQDVTPEEKILKLEGKYFLDDVEGGIRMSLVGEVNDLSNDFILSVIRKNITNVIPESFNIEKLSKVNMSGVTAISRNLASKVELSGENDYPAKNIGEFLADADLTHTSNEVSFVEGCTPDRSMRFCSAPKYIETLEASGIDIVELTGNHNNDYGASNNTTTIEMYKERGWDYFGGGLNSEDASEILYKEVNGTKIAFLGYNYYDTMLNTGALAGENRAGANSYSASKMQMNIEEARENADIVIVDFQFQECYSYPSSDIIYPICYKPLSSPDQKGVFRLAIDYGANIVIGTQAHQPQTYEIYGDGVIFYGLGNLYFDQIRWIGTRQGMILTHYFYDGKHIQTKITPTIYDRDMQTRIATEEEGNLLLELLREAR